ncbi:MAG: ATP-binding protein [Myxococcota bacterium]
MNTPRPLNARVLVIDDEESVRDGFRTVLAAPRRRDEQLAEAADALFDDAPLPTAMETAPRFEVDTASTGAEGIAFVEAALAAGRPYAAIFCDMRMPGLDGVETIERVRALDPRAEIVFVTAYSDHSVDSIVQRAGADVGYFVKPFLTDEVKQLATKLVLDWNRARELEDLVRTVTTLRGDARDVDLLVRHLLGEICRWLDTRSAAILRDRGGGDLVHHLGVGELASTSPPVEAVAGPPADARVLHLPDGTLVFPVKRFGMALAMPGDTRITPDRLYLLQVFIEHAALAIHNSEMHARLLEQERMAAVGQAIAFVVHDLRNPIGAAQGYARLLRAGIVDEAARDETLGRIGLQLQRALDLLDDTLAFVQGHGAVRLGDADLADALAHDLALLARQLEERGVRLVVDIPRGLRARLDPDRFWRAVWNLVRNATEALSTTSAPRVEVCGRPDASGGVLLEVRDNGPGLPEAILGALFQPFASAGKREGTGFGLAIVHQIVTAHGGEVTYLREPGLSVFRMRLPAP